MKKPASPSIPRAGSAPPSSTTAAPPPPRVYSHEYGRHILENFTDGQVRTLSYENVRTDGEVDQAVEDAVRRGANVIFTTTPKLLLSSVRQAALHPDVKILNCSEHLLPLGAAPITPGCTGPSLSRGPLPAL